MAKYVTRNIRIEEVRLFGLMLIGYVLYYVGIPGPAGKPITARCISKRSVKATITRWRKRHGEPVWISYPLGLSKLWLEYDYPPWKTKRLHGL